MVTAILVLLLITGLAFTITIVAQREYRSAVRDVRKSAVFYAANSGLEYATAMLVNDDHYSGGVMPRRMSSLPGHTEDDIEIFIDLPLVIRQDPPYTHYVLRSTATLLGTKMKTAVVASVKIKKKTSAQMYDFQERKKL